jgi:putative ABC transport system ATP-binding protein
MVFSKRFQAMTLVSGLSKKYILLAFLYGLSTLIIPLATQYLVNSLALSSIFANTLVFLVLILICLTISWILKYAQLIVLEIIQRKIFVAEAIPWMKKVNAERSHYMLEIQTLMKSYSTAWSHLVELGLSLLFGLLVILSIHPAFIILPILISGGLWFIFSLWGPAVTSCLVESDEKYYLVKKKFNDQELSDSEVAQFLQARDGHFKYVKLSTIIVAFTFIFTHLYLLGVGIYLIELANISVGQLVAAEIILTGIMVSISKLPKTMEGLYDLETSKIKIERALEVKS